VSLANALAEKGHDAHAVEGEKSQFDVIADGDVIFSKQQVGRFPEEAEINSKL
jgi:hypothetical protein